MVEPVLEAATKLSVRPSFVAWGGKGGGEVKFIICPSAAIFILVMFLLWNRHYDIMISCDIIVIKVIKSDDFSHLVELLLWEKDSSSTGPFAASSVSAKIGIDEY